MKKTFLARVLQKSKGRFLKKIYMLNPCLKKDLFGTGPAGPDTRMDTVTACHFPRNRVLDFLRPAAAGGGCEVLPDSRSYPCYVCGMNFHPVARGGTKITT